MYRTGFRFLSVSAQCHKIATSLLLAGFVAGVLGQAWAGEKFEYKDIYLRENRVCKSCRLEWVDKTNVRLVNRAGQASIVPVREVLGIDRHPIVRKAMLHALKGVGLPGEVIVPSAFDDGNDFVCKYCDTFNR